MAYQALYRQWRSRSFSGIVGQDAIITTLRRQVETGRVAHAYLFSGTRGTGKTSTAQIFSRAINCQSPQQGEACGVCESCDALDSGASLDIEEIDAASNNGVDEIRALRDKIRYPPQSGKYRVYIVDEVHMLSTSAFNALLKTLEEPPPHAVFILATTEPQRLPATILSRCQRFDFKRIAAAEIAKRLREAADGEGASCDEDALGAIARAAEGSMRDGLSLLDVCIAAGGKVTAQSVEAALGTAGGAFLEGIADALAHGDVAAILRGVDRAMRDGRDAAVLARGICGHLRDMMVSPSLGAQDAASVLEITNEEAVRLREQAEAMGIERTMRALSVLSRVEPEMRWAAHPRTLLELALARSCRADEESDLEALLQRIETLEKAIEHGVPARAEVAPKEAPASSAAFVPYPVKAAPAAEPAAKAASAPPAALPSDSALWKDALAAIRKGHISLYTALRRAQFDGMSDGAARISFAPEDEVFCKMMQVEQNLAALNEALAQAAGGPIAARVSLRGAAEAPEPEKPDDKWVKDAISLFGRDKVDIIEGGEGDL